MGKISVVYVYKEKGTNEWGSTEFPYDAVPGYGNMIIGSECCSFKDFKKVLDECSDKSLTELIMTFLRSINYDCTVFISIGFRFDKFTRRGASIRKTSYNSEFTPLY